MELTEGVLLIIIILFSIIFSGINASKVRAKIKARAIHEYKIENELTQDELESRLLEAEIMYEDLEQTYWVHVGVLIGVALYFCWHIWYLSIAISVLIIFVGDKYLSIKPFKSSSPP
jgi:hypothetical protein